MGAHSDPRNGTAPGRSSAGRTTGLGRSGNDLPTTHDIDSPFDIVSQASGAALEPNGVPEPGPMALVGIGLLAAAAKRRRR